MTFSVCYGVTVSGLSVNIFDYSSKTLLWVTMDTHLIDILLRNYFVTTSYTKNVLVYPSHLHPHLLAPAAGGHPGHLLKVHRDGFVAILGGEGHGALRPFPLPRARQAPVRGVVEACPRAAFAVPVHAM